MIKAIGEFFAAVFGLILSTIFKFAIAAAVVALFVTATMALLNWMLPEDAISLEMRVLYAAILSFLFKWQLSDTVRVWEKHFGQGTSEKK
jgi:ABC-type multidrug transport system permease subunit